MPPTQTHRAYRWVGDLLRNPSASHWVLLHVKGGKAGVASNLPVSAFKIGSCRQHLTDEGLTPTDPLFSSSPIFLLLSPLFSGALRSCSPPATSASGLNGPRRSARCPAAGPAHWHESQLAPTRSLSRQRIPAAAIRPARPLSRRESGRVHSPPATAAAAAWQSREKEAMTRGPARYRRAR